MKLLLLVCLLVFLSAQCPAATPELPAVTHYGLQVRFQLKEQRISASATLTIMNATRDPCARLPFLLYRLLGVERVENEHGQPLPFTQSVVPLDDEPSLQATAVVVNLPSPLAPGDSLKMMIRYAGFIFGYPEVMAYVQDRIDEEYALLRPDAFAYPVLAQPTFASTLAASETKFTYEIAAMVPGGYRVACGGELTDLRTGVDSSTFVYRSKVPTWRIDVAAAKFALLENRTDRLAVYHLPADSTGAARVLDAARDAVNLYSSMFGTPAAYRGYTIIEIPAGWGSQASDYYFLQTAEAFRDSSRIPEVYHEIGHTWNAVAAGGIQRCRYFDEAFASFFQALAVRAFRGETAFRDAMEKNRDRFARAAGRDSAVFATPIADYGTRELGRYSYNKGAWSLYVLYRLAGEDAFNSIMRQMLAEFSARAIDFHEFQKLCERVTHRDLRTFFQEWIYGSASSKLLVDNVRIEDIVARY